MTTTEPCLGLYKALYSYAAQGEDEVSVDEDQLVFLLDTSDDDWSKIRVKPALDADAEGPEGLVPAAYLEKATPTSFVKALYDYAAAAPGEVTVADGQVLSVHEKEDDWILVEFELDGKKGKFLCGYVPANYVEEADAEDISEPAPAPAPAPVKTPTIIIPDSPPRPAYIAPEERTASTHNDKAKQDPIETWAVSQLDKKGKKKKGTLGVGNGNVFFASESDKTPVQKWQTGDISSVSLDKSKHVEINFANGTETLHFISKDAAEAIKNKLESSRAIATGGVSPGVNGDDTPRQSTDSRAITNPYTPRAMEVISPPKAVHFAPSTSEIPPRPDTPEEYEHDYSHHGTNGRSSEDSAEAPHSAISSEDGEMAVVLYDFSGDAADELSVKEGEQLLVLDRSNDDWWKCRNSEGEEGVVPAQYVDLEIGDEQPSPATASPASASARGVGAAASAAAAAAASRAVPVKAPSPEPEPEEDEVDSEEERMERERKEKEDHERKERKDRERKEKERARAEREEEERRARAEEEERIAAERKRAEEKKAKAAEKAREEARVRREAEDRKAAKAKKLQKEKEKAKPKEDASDTDEDDNLAEEARQIALRRQLDKDNERQGQGRPVSTGSRTHGPPPTGKTRVWHDKSGQFRVEAEFKGFENGKIRLHKLNGVTIEVPAEKMSPEDLKYIAKTTGQSTSRGGRSESMDVSRDSVDRTIKLPSANVPGPSASPRPRQENAQPKKRVDWFEFFLNAGCDMDDCTRYSQAFERDKIDESILPDMKSDTLRALGLREGDIIRVTRAIEKRGWKSRSVNDEPAVMDQIQADALYAQQVQEAILAGKKPPPPPGPLPQRKPTSPPPNIFTGPGGALKDNTRRGRVNTTGKSTTVNVDENLLANVTTQLGTPTSATRNNRTPSPNLIDAGSTSTSTSAAKPSGFDDDAWTPRPSSTNPISPVVAVTPPAAPSSAPPAPAPPTLAAPAPSAASMAPARPSTAGANPATDALSKELELLQKIADLKRPPSAPAPSNMAPAPPPVPSPSMPTGYANNFATGAGLSPSPSLQPQQTGFYGGAANGIRGPFAPVPANAPVLLKPLVPTNTAMSGFVPTRPSPMNNSLAPQPLLSQMTGFSPQINPFQPQPTGFQPSFQPQMTGFQPQQTGFQPQQTGFQPSFQPQMTGFQSAFQPQPTGFQMAQPTGLAPLNTGLPYGMRSTPSPIPPVPSMPSQYSANPGFNSQPITTQPFGSMNFGPPSASPPPTNNAPANIFAAMKAGNFGGEEQNAPNYDAMRTSNVSPLQSQPTGWVPGMQMGYQYR